VKAVYAVGALIAAIAVSLPAGTGTVDEPIIVRRIDWVLLNARVDLLTDAMTGRFSRSISPPIYKYKAPARRIIALATVAEGTNVNQPAFRRSLADAAQIFACNPICRSQFCRPIRCRVSPVRRSFIKSKAHVDQSRSARLK